MRTGKIAVLLMLTVLLCSCSLWNGGLFHKKMNSSTEVLEKDVPPALKEAFTFKYPGLLPDKWYKISETKYAASFQKDGIYKYAYFTNSGIFKDEEINEELYYDPYDDWEWEEIPEDYF